MTSWHSKLKQLGCVVIIPTYNNDKTLSKLIDDVLIYACDVIVVNDGSTDKTAEILLHRKDVVNITYTPNKGKGNALKVGLRKALELKFKYAITIDSDGQHYAEDIIRFIEEAEKNPNSLLVGARNLTAENMPGKNTFANKFSNFWFKVETWITMDDTQSGYRLYPLDRLKEMRFITPRYEFELEILVRAAWRGIPVKNIPIKVFYPEGDERISHFRPLRDFTRISILNTFLVLIALLYYYPFKFIEALKWSNIKQFVHDHITHSKESNQKVSLSVALGIFFGIIPIWGYQMITAGVVAHFLKLNKIVAIAVSNISIPPMIPFILYGSVLTGSIMLQEPVAVHFSSISLDSITSCMYQYVVGSFILATLSSIVVGSITFLILCISRKN